MSDFPLSTFSLSDLLRVPFKENGRSPSEGFDCAGLVIWLLNQRGLAINEPSVFLSPEAKTQALLHALARHCDPVDYPEPGAVVAFRDFDDPRFTTHVGLILTSGKDFIHISCRSVRVCIESINPLWIRRVTGYYRPRLTGDSC